MTHKLLQRGMLAWVLATSGCIQAVDNAWFDPEPTDAYMWPHNDVPDTHIELVELQGTALEPGEEAPRLFGVWAKQCLAPNDCLGVNYPERQRVIILYLHGNAAHLQRYWDRVQILWRLGYTVFAVDYRGYGRSTGTPSEAGIYADGRTALAHVHARAPTLGADALVYYGYSLGSTVAVQLGVESTPHAVVLEAPLASGQAFVDDAAGIGLDASVLMDTEFDNLGKIPHLQAPKLIMHGLDDTFVRFEFGELLYEAALAPKELRPVAGAEHGNVPCPDRDTSVSSEEQPCIASNDYRTWLTDMLDAHAH